MFSLHLTVPPDGSSPGERLSDHDPHRRGAPRTAPCAPQLCCFAQPSSSSHIHRSTGLAGSSRSRAASGLRQVTDYPDLRLRLSLGAKAKGLHWETARLLLCTGLLVHLEFPLSFLATLLKLPGKLLWLKISSSTPGVSAQVWIWTDYLCCWNTSTVGKSTIN